MKNEQMIQKKTNYSTHYKILKDLHLENEIILKSCFIDNIITLEKEEVLNHIKILEKIEEKMDIVLNEHFSHYGLIIYNRKIYYSNIIEENKISKNWTNFLTEIGY